MKIRTRLAALPLTALVTLAPNVPAQSLGGIETEQNQQQRREYGGATAVEVGVAPEGPPSVFDYTVESRRST